MEDGFKAVKQPFAKMLSLLKEILYSTGFQGSRDCRAECFPVQSHPVVVFLNIQRNDADAAFLLGQHVTGFFDSVVAPLGIKLVILLKKLGGMVAVLTDKMVQART